MGHPKSEFETIMMSLACGSKGPGLKGSTEQVPELKTLSGQPKPLLDLGKAMTEIPALLKKIETHTFELGHEFLKPHSGNFTRKDIYFDVDGLVVLYHCSRDDRMYTVKITASK